MMRQAIVSFQQLGIIRFDISPRQFIDGKLGDFSVAVITPHIMTNPEQIELEQPPTRN